MKTWFQNRRLRHQCSEASLPVHRFELIEREEIAPGSRHIHMSGNKKGPTSMAVSAMASRMSIERYLKAPLSDEPASAPAINDALRKQIPRDWIDSPATLYNSRETSVDVHSEGRPTFFTSGSVPETVDTSYTVDSKSKPHRSIAPSYSTIHPNTQWLHSHDVRGTSLDKLTTGVNSGPIDMAREWADRVEKLMPGYSPDQGIDYRAKAELEIMRIQEKAKELELMMRQFKIERNVQGHNASKTTDESARMMMAANPKLAWILGGDTMNVRSVPQPKTALSTTDDIPDSPRSTGKAQDIPYGRLPRKSKSNGALDEAVYKASSNVPRPDNVIEQQPSKRSRFYCTFCQKRYHSQDEWLRHERTIHMPEELWVCCPRTGEFPKRCPFCEKGHPSPAHLADHNYLSCQEKPLSERTFARKDHFLLHISQVHKVSPSQKPARLTELENAWRHALPVRIGHQALHCGFCGEIFESYQDRTTHVSRHFSEGADMMSWWKDRISHDVKSRGTIGNAPNSGLPHKCVYCERTFKNFAVAQKLHPTCAMWSCSFLPGLRYTIYPTGSQSKPEAVCCYCNDALVQGEEGKVNGALLKEHMTQHNFRACSQTLYFSGQRFRQHLQDSHKSSYDSTLFAGWTLLLKSSRRDKPSRFEQIEAKGPSRRSNTDPGVAMSKSKSKQKKKSKEKVEAVPTNFMEFTEIPQRTEPNKLRRKQSIPGEESRPSTQFFDRSATTEFGDIGETLAASISKPTKSSASGTPTCPTFYRRRLDASTRNRIYLHEDDEPLNNSSQQLLRRIPGSVLGGLILHSSLAAAVPALMTNCVDIYPLH